MHKAKVFTSLFKTLVPKKFIIIRDELPGLKLIRPELIIAKNESFEEPLSLNAEISIS
jgi:hypothetical protein